MDKQIRIPPESHRTLAEYAERRRISIRQAATEAVDALLCRVVVAVNADGDHDIVELYSQDDHANNRSRELIDSGFKGRNVSVASRCVLAEPPALRKYGPEWKKAVGWTPSPGEGSGELEGGDE